MTDLSGQYLERYHLLERLGEGGMATVYKAYDTRLEREVAVKIIRHNAFPSEKLEEVLKRFEREAKSLARLSHPNIVKVHDYGEHQGAPFLVLEYLPGGTLKKMLGKPMPWNDAIRLLLPVARGVAYAHQHGILHRDIKPANILITEGGEPMLSDFGIAKIFEGGQSAALTASGMFVGTPEYTAPEQWTGTTSPQSDLYSLGILFYEMVTGRKPYIADTPAAILLKQAYEPLPRPREFVPDLPEPVEWLLIKALARDPADRYEDVNAMVSAMEGLLSFQVGPAQPHPVVTNATLKQEKPASVDLQEQSQPQGAARGVSKSRVKHKMGILPIATIAICILGTGMLGVICLLISSTTPTDEAPTANPIATDALVPVPSNTAAMGEQPAVVLFDGYAAQTFSDKPDVIAYANVHEFPPPEGVTVLDNCTDTVCWRSSQFLALRGPGTFLVATASFPEVGVQFWGDTNDGLCRVLIDGEEVWKGDTYGTNVNWPGGAFVKYLYISGLLPRQHTIRVEFVGPGDVTVRYFGFGPTAP